MISNNSINNFDTFGLFGGRGKGYATVTLTVTDCCGNTKNIKKTVKTVDELLDLIRSVGEGETISSLTIVGHGIGGDLVIGDTLLTYMPSQPTNTSSSTRNMASSDIQALITSKFSTDAKIDLVACESASGGGVAQALKDALPDSTVSGQTGKIQDAYFFQTTGIYVFAGSKWKEVK